MSLGVDISDIEQVIQWGITKRLTLDTLVQCISCAAHKSLLLGLVIICTPQDLLDPVTKEHLKVTNPPQPTPQREPQIEDIPLDPAPDQEWEDIVDVVPWYAGHDLCTYTLRARNHRRSSTVENEDVPLHQYYQRYCQRRTDNSKAK